MARPVWSGPTLNRNVAPASWRRRISTSRGTPSRVPRSVSTSIFSASSMSSPRTWTRALRIGDALGPSLDQRPSFRDLAAVGVEDPAQGLLHRYQWLPVEIGAGPV